MQIVKMNEVNGKEVREGVMVKKLIRHEYVQVMNLNLSPGSEVPAHNVPVEVFFYVVGGKGTIKIGNEEAVFKRDDIVLCPAGTDMSLRADQGEEFAVLNVKTPGLQQER